MATAKAAESVKREDAPAPPTIDDLNTGKGKPSNLMTADEYHRYFNPVATWYTFYVTGA